MDNDIFSATSGVPMSEDGLKEVASHSATRFLENGLDLNETIAHEAVDRGLSLEQIKRVLELANHMVYKHYLDNGDPRTEFAVADIEKIAPHVFPDLGCEGDGGEEYDDPPFGDVLEDPTQRESLDKIPEADVSKTASVSHTERLEDLYEQRKALEKFADGAEVDQQIDLDCIYKEACSLLAGGTSLDEQLYAAATCFPESTDDLHRLFSKIGKRMWADGLVEEQPKVAIVTVRHENLTPVIVRGEPGGVGSPLIKLIARSIERDRTLEKSTWGRGILDQKIKMHIQKSPTSSGAPVGK